MYVSGVGCALPSERIFNQEVLELIAYYSRGVYAGDLRALISGIDAKLRRAGIVSRYWRSARQRPIALLMEACEFALKQSGIAGREVDFVIYVGVDRGFAEPANASFVAKELGVDRAKTFDIADACLGWATGAEIAQALFASAPGAVALIVSAEFPMRLNGSVLPQCFTIASDDELEWKFPAFTLGEAATASVLTRDGPAWRYVHESHNMLADLCTVGLGPSSDYAGPSPRLDPSETRGFRAYGRELAKHTIGPAVRVLRELLSLMGGAPRVVFPHSVMGPIVADVAARVSPDLTVFSTFADQGNVATSSLPSCIFRARQQGVVKGEDSAIGWIAASGLKVSAVEIIQKI
jgi:3-oxoacyl-[acyl-carrier-protein] synthase III